MGDNYFLQFHSGDQGQSGGNFFEQFHVADGRDKEHRAARQWLDAHPEYDHGSGRQLGNKFLQGATMGWADEARALTNATIGGFRDRYLGGGGPGATERYRLEKAMQDEMLKSADRDQGAWGTAAEVAGAIPAGLMTAGPVGRAVSAIAGRAAPAVNAVAEALGPHVPGAVAGAARLAGNIASNPLAAAAGRGAVEGAGFGAVAGAGGADGDRLGGAGKGAVMGGALGGAAPLAIAAGGGMLSGLGSRLSAINDPNAYAERKLAQIVNRSGMTAQDVQTALAEARNAGQGNYAVADALGPEGQSALAALMKLPGAARSEAARWLWGRNEGMARPVTGFVDQAFGTNGYTAKQFLDEGKQFRTDVTGPLYKQAEEVAGPVDLSPTMRTLEGMLDPAGVMPGGFANGGAQSAASPGVKRAAQMFAPEGLGDTAAANFRLVLDRKQQLDDMISEAMRDGRSHEAGQLISLRDGIDEALAQSSPGYAGARDTFKQMSQPINAVPRGQQAFSSGRSADNIRAFNGMTPEAQGGFRVGYADKVNAKIGGGQVGSTINSMLRDGDVAQEVGAFAAPGRGPLLDQQLRRAQTMMSTGNRSLGGSPTNELGVMQEDLGIDPVPIVGHLFAGNLGGAAKAAVREGVSRLAGNTEPVRNRLIPMLTNAADQPAIVDLPGVVNAYNARAASAAQNARAMSTGFNAAATPWDRNAASPVPVEMPLINVGGRR